MNDYKKSESGTHNNHCGACWKDHARAHPDELKALVKAFPSKLVREATNLLTDQPIQGRDVGQVPVPRLHMCDLYAMIVIALPLTPIIILSMLLGYILTLPTLGVLRLYICLLRKPTVRIIRNCGFFVVSTLLFLMSLPMLCLVGLFLLILSIWVSLTSLVYSVLSLKLFRFTYANLQILKPYRKSGLWNWNDIVCCIAGALHRQGYWEFWSQFPLLFFVTPVAKYAFTTNPLLHNLSEKYINQWSPPLQVSPQGALAGLISNVSWALHTGPNRELIDEARFSAHYPLPPPHRPGNDVIGLQFIQSSILNFTYTIHNVDNKVRSETGVRGVYIVPLYFWNPFHILTGYVEVNIRKEVAFEHPMWCLTGENHWGNKFYRNVDALFWAYGVEAAAYTNTVGGNPDRLNERT